MADRFGGILVEDDQDAVADTPIAVDKFGGRLIASEDTIAPENQQINETDIPSQPLTPMQKLMAKKTGRVSPISGMPIQEVSPTAETITSIATAVPSQVASGFSGMLAIPSAGFDKAADYARNVQSSLQYTPKSERSREQLETIAEAPIIKQIGQVMELYSEKADELSGGIADEGYPGAAATIRGVAEVIPDVIGLVVGSAAVKPTIKAARMTKQGIENTVKTIAGTPDIRVFDSAGMVTPEALELLRSAQTRGVDIDSVANKEILKSIDDGQLLTPDDLNILTAQAKQSAIDSGTQPLTAIGMIENYNLFKKRGVEPTRANVTQDIDDWRFQQDSIKQSGDVSRMVAEQDRVLAELAREGKEQIGYIADDLPSTNESLFHTVNDLAETYDTAVSNAYRLARESAGKNKDIKLTGFVDELKRNAGNENSSGGIISSVRQELKNRGVSQKGFTAEGKIDVNTAEAIRQHLNRLYSSNSTTDFGKQIIHELKESLDNDVAATVGEDVFREARMAKKDFHDAFSRGKVNKWERTQQSFINDVLTGKVKQDDIVNKLGKLPPEQFDDARDFFLNRAGDAGISAWNNYKAALLDDAITKAQGSMSGAIDGDRILTFNSKQFERVFKPLTLSKASKRKGAPTKFEAIFTPEEQSLINDIIAIGELRRPQKAVALGSGPSGMAVMDMIQSVIDAPISIVTKGRKPAQALRSSYKRMQDKKFQKEFTQPQVLIEEKIKSAR